MEIKWNIKDSVSLNEVRKREKEAKSKEKEISKLVNINPNILVTALNANTTGKMQR